MTGKKAGRNLREERNQQPDCGTCIHRDGCARYAENSFCTRWQGREPQPQGEDPNQRWRRGEDADF